MLIGSKPLGTLPIGAIPAAISKAVGDPFAKLLQNPDAEFVFLLIATPYDPSYARTVATLPGPIGAQPIGAAPPLTVTGGERTVYLSDKGWKTTPSETPANQNFPGRLLSPYNFEVDAFSGAEPSGVAQMASSGAGSIVADNGDGGLDAWLAYGWDGRPLEVRAGAKGFAFADFATVFKGVCLSLAWDRSTLTWNMADRSVLFAQPLQQRLYTGNGGLEGGADIAGKPKPKAWGAVTAVEPVLVDSPNQVYQWNDGSVNSVSRVTDKAIPLTYDGDQGNIYSSAPAAGHVSSCNALGLIRLGSPPAGKVALDGSGDASGSDYVSTAGTILKRIATTCLGINSLQDPQDIDGASFAALETSFPYAVGLYIRDVTNADVAMDALMFTANGWWTFTRTGTLSVGTIQAPTNPVRTIADRDIAPDTGFKLISVIPPAWRRAVGYDEVWAVHGAADLAASVSDADRLLLTNQFRYPTPTIADAQLTAHKLARDVVRNSLIHASADATSAQAAQQAAHGVERRVYEAPVARALFRYFLGDVVTLQRTRFGLSAGKPFVVKGIIENARGQKTTLRLWG